MTSRDRYQNSLLASGMSLSSLLRKGVDGWSGVEIPYVSSLALLYCINVFSAVFKSVGTMCYVFSARRVLSWGCGLAALVRFQSQRTNYARSSAMCSLCQLRKNTMARLHEVGIELCKAEESGSMAEVRL